MPTKFASKTITRDPNWLGPAIPPGELLFELLRGHDRFRVELRDNGETYGVEAQFYQNEEILIARRFEQRMDPTRTPREMAISWAGEERKAIEKGDD